MTIPGVQPIPETEPWALIDPELEWAALSTDAKRERILCAAGLVFTREGLDAPMPAVAAMAGSGVASVYRQFPSKQDLVAALVERRLNQVTDLARAAWLQTGTRWAALTGLLRDIHAGQRGDDFLGEAWKQVAEHPAVVEANGRTIAALELVLAGARDEGRLRRDATTLDLRLLFAATRAAKQIEPTAWQRMLDLFIDGLDSTR